MLDKSLVNKYSFYENNSTKITSSPNIEATNIMKGLKHNHIKKFYQNVTNYGQNHFPGFKGVRNSIMFQTITPFF